MLFSTYKRFNYTVDAYKYRLVTSADGTVTEKRYDTIPETYNVQISTSFIGDLVILTNAKFQKEAILENLRDRNGNEIYTGGVWSITNTQPVTNAMGLVEGYKYKAKLINGEV